MHVVFFHCSYTQVTRKSIINVNQLRQYYHGIMSVFSALTFLLSDVAF